MEAGETMKHISYIENEVVEEITQDRTVGVGPTMEKRKTAGVRFTYIFMSSNWRTRHLKLQMVKYSSC